MINFNNLKKISDFDLTDDNTVIDGYILTVPMCWEGCGKTKLEFISYCTDSLYKKEPFIKVTTDIVGAILFPSLDAIKENIEEIDYQLNHNFPYWSTKGYFKFRKFTLNSVMGAIV